MARTIQSVEVSEGLKGAFRRIAVPRGKVDEAQKGIPPDALTSSNFERSAAASR